ncbi:MAG: BamA/TamA family outer membrane protein [Vicinamibacteria bacterium]|nr:BamA/TamA family outer membrane protein [Vicinamibacteria bacterium]
MKPARLLALLLAAGRLGAAEPPVVDVRVEGPAELRGRLSRYVGLETGAPLDAEAVRRSVERLFATGELEDVQVEKEAAADGTRVRFVLVPLPRLHGVRTEPGDVLDGGDARRIAGLRDREPLDAVRLDRAAQALALELERRGYLEARVSGRLERDGARADAVFAIEAGRRARVSSVRLRGAPAAHDARLRGPLLALQGRHESRSRAEAVAEDARRALVVAGHWRAKVDVRRVYDPAAAEVALEFVAEAGPRLVLRFEGPPLPGSVRSRVSRLIVDGRAATDALDAAAEQVEAWFASRGHRGAETRWSEVAAPGGQELVYATSAGPATRLAAVALEAFPPGLALPPLASRADAPARDALLEQDRRALEAALREHGHPDAAVELDLPESGDHVTATFRARPGRRVIVSAFEVRPDVPLPEEAEPRELRLRAGAPYRVTDVALDRAALLSAWRNAGYQQVEVTPELAFAEDGQAVAVTLAVAAGPRTFVDRIVVAGLERTREEVVRRELRITEGAPLGLADAIESQRRLSALGLFGRVDLAEVETAAGTTDVVVQLDEAPRTTVGYGIGFGERDLLRASLELGRRNLGGRDRTGALFLRGSYRGSRLLGSYREPFLFGSRRELLVTAFREEEDRDNFDFRRMGLSVQVAQAIDARLSLVGRLLFQDTDTNDVVVACDEVDRQFCDAAVTGPSVSLVLDERDDALDPRRGFFLGADVLYSSRLLGGDNFLKAFAQAAVFERLQRRLSFALSARVGLARTLGLDEPLLLPLPERFFAGGDYSLRGFAPDAVAPKGGNALLLGSGELRFEVRERASLAAFADVGNVYPLVGDVSLRDLRYAAGIGLRYRSPLGPLRLDWGYKLNRRPGESRSRFHVTVGHAF